MPNPDYRALCAEILQTLDQYEDGQRVDWDAWRETARAALAQPEPVLTVQECNNMRKHRETYMHESRDGKEIQLDGWFTREDLIELAHTKPTIH